MADTTQRTGTTTSAVNLRNGPGTTYDVITTLKPSTKVTIVGDADGWYKVNAGGQEGFVCAKFILLSSQKLQDGFIIHQPDVESIPLAPTAPLSIPSGANGTVKTVVSIWNKFGGLLQALASQIGIDPATALAVVATESGGSGFKNGKMIIRFENHYFWKLWGKNNTDVFNTFFTFNQAKPWTQQQFRSAADQPWQEFHGNQDKEWIVFEKAASLNENAAKSSISMGLPQIMGSNCTAIGYESAAQMFEAFSIDERRQIIGLFDFIQGPHNVSPSVTALQNKDFTGFAARYNGSGQAAAYGAILQKFYDAFSHIS